jgi:hypothetical protein
MIYEVQCQFIPGNSQIWVARLNSEDPIYKYDNVEEAQAKANELQAADETGRQYRVTGLETAAPTEETLTEETPIEEVPVETSIEEIPTEETLTEETPIEENPT